MPDNKQKNPVGLSKFGKIVAAGSALVMTTAAQAATTMPTADYTDIEAAATIGFAVVLTVGLLMKAKGFFR